MSASPESHPESMPPERPSRWRRWLVELGVIVLILYGFHLWQTRGAASGQAPELAGVDLAGHPLRLEEGPAVVHFWATWCGVCDAMDDNVAAVAGDHRVLTVAVRSEGPGAIREHLADEGLEGAFPVIVDPRGALAERWGVAAFPTTFVVDGDRSIRATSVGYTTTLGLRARMLFAD